jgi:hypothetical protein
MGAHVWNGTKWLPVKTMPIWNGSAWVAGNRKVWNGSSWVGFQDDITLQEDFVSGTGFDNAEADWGINSSTGYIIFGGDVSGDQYPFCLNVPNLGQYQIKVDRDSGSFKLGSSPEGTWISCATSPMWSVRTTSGESDVYFTATVRNTITEEVITAQSISLIASTFD